MSVNSDSTLWFYPIDWSSTGSMLSVVVAAAALAHSVFTAKQVEREAKASQVFENFLVLKLNATHLRKGTRSFNKDELRAFRDGAKGRLLGVLNSPKFVSERAEVNRLVELSDIPKPDRLRMAVSNEELADSNDRIERWNTETEEFEKAWADLESKIFSKVDYRGPK